MALVRWLAIKTAFVSPSGLRAATPKFSIMDKNSKRGKEEQMEGTRVLLVCAA